MQTESSYRPHDPGNDYYDRGIYHITLVVSGREDLFYSQLDEVAAIAKGRLSYLNMDERQPGVRLTKLGEAVKEEWEKTAAIQASKGRKIKLHACVCMPDHFHGVIEVEERMDKCLGDIIQYFKSACTNRYRKLTGAIVSPSWGKKISNMGKAARAAAYLTVPRIYRPLFDDNYDDTICLRVPAVDGNRRPALGVDGNGRPTLGVNGNGRPALGANGNGRPALGANGNGRPALGADGNGGPLWAYDQRHLAAMIGYVNDNPRRAIMRKLHPEFMQRQLHVRIATGKRGADGEPEYRDYGAFGNLFLLRWARKVQVFCHRKARYGMLSDEEKLKWGYAHGYGIDISRIAGKSHAAYADDYVTSVPYEKTAAYRSECVEWKRMVMEGATVMVTPGISMGERIIKDRCIESGYPLIHIQKEPIGRYWKPEASRFKACENGSMLILAPWKPEEMGDINGVPKEADYSIFHNLNMVAEEICRFDGDARMVVRL